MVQEILLDEQIEWPKPYKCAVTLIFNYQGAEGLEPGPNGKIDNEIYSEREYGPRAGIWRILRLLEKQNVKATFAVCGGLAERYPATVKAIHAAGHEVAGHGYHHEMAWKLSRDQELETITKTTDILGSFTDERIRGWRCCFQSHNTPELVLEQGFLWNSNSFSHDFPYLLRKDGRVTVEIPRQPFGDMRVYGHEDFGNPGAALDVWRRAFDTFYNESELFHTFCPFSFHPYISGRPGRIEVLSELIEYIKGHQGVWIATCEEIAKISLECAVKTGKPDIRETSGLAASR